MKWLFVGNTPTTAKSRITSQKDVCFKCSRLNPCRELIQKASDPIKVLMDYREEWGKKYIVRVRNNDDKAFKELLANPLLIKFLVPYSLVVENKRFLMDIGILQENEVLRKDQGKYCPYEDYWELRVGV